MMETYPSNSLNFESYVYQEYYSFDNTLDDAQLETRCPLDNGRHDFMPISTSFAAGQLDRLPVELIIEILLRLDIPSLTRFRSLSHRTMDLVNSVCQYTVIIKHCPDIIRAIVSIQADAFNCDTLYRTLCTSRCSTCSHFGYYLYLIDCRRVCYICFTRRPEYFPLTSREAYELFISNAELQSHPKRSRRKLFESVKVKLPSILSLPGEYCSSLLGGESTVRRRLRLYDRQAVVPSLAGSGLPQSDKTTEEPKRFMAIISAPVLLNGGQQVDDGFFCYACLCQEEVEGMLSRIKYTTEGMVAHIASYGQVVESPEGPIEVMHVIKDRTTV